MGEIPPHFYKALQFIKNKRTKYPFANIVTTKYRLEQINDALANMGIGDRDQTRNRQQGTIGPLTFPSLPSKGRGRGEG